MFTSLRLAVLHPIYQHSLCMSFISLNIWPKIYHLLKSFCSLPIFNCRSTWYLYLHMVSVRNHVVSPGRWGSPLKPPIAPLCLSCRHFFICHSFKLHTVHSSETLLLLAFCIAIPPFSCYFILRVFLKIFFSSRFSEDIKSYKFIQCNQY